MDYKMIVLDLDGTLTNSKKEMTSRTRDTLLKAEQQGVRIVLASGRTRDTLLKAEQQGVRIVLASGRPTYGITALAEELDLKTYRGFILAFNGGRITDCATGKVVFDLPLNPEVVPPLYEAVKKHGMEMLTYQDEKIAATKKANKYVLHEAFINKMPIVEYTDFIHQIRYPINKCLVVGDPAPLHELELQLAETFKGVMDVYRSAGFFLECVPPGIDKAHSLERLFELTGIRREEVIACGDGYNDQSMIRFAGLGVAMANAPKDIQDSANYITYSNEEDGVAHVVEKFILK